MAAFEKTDGEDLQDDNNTSANVKENVLPAGQAGSQQQTVEQRENASPTSS